MNGRFLLVLALAGCASSSMISEGVARMTTSELWSDHRTETSAVSLSLIEVELVSRGETQTYGDYVGRRTSGAFGQTLYPREVRGANLKNCADFANSAEAQRYFLIAGGPVRDPNGLDADGDGLACEWGTKIRKIASYGPLKSTYTRKRYSSGGCHVGPRGGTYTITASGKKNYGGC